MAMPFHATLNMHVPRISAPDMHIQFHADPDMHTPRTSARTVQTVRTQLQTEHLNSSARLQEQNEELRSELEAMEALNRRLEERQAQLVMMQSAVADLWGRCQDDPQVRRPQQAPWSGCLLPATECMLVH